MDPAHRWTSIGFQLIIEKQFPHVDVTLGAFHSLRPGTEPVNRDFVAYGFLSSMRWTAFTRATTEQLYPANKFQVLETSILENQFVGPAQKKDIVNKFCSAQRTYATLCRGARRWKVARANRADVNTDLYMRPLSALPEGALLELYHDDSRTMYTYRISDLLRIIRSALGAAPDFFVAPQPIRNPYTNQEFTDAQLYTIYQRIKESSYEIPTVFHMYRAAGMRARGLMDKGEAFIREEAIDDALHMPSDRKYRYITQMLQEYQADVAELAIHPRFPRTNLVAAFASFLPTYLRVTHSLHPDLRRRSRRVLKETLRRFVDLNPLYGRIKEAIRGGPYAYHTEIVQVGPPPATPEGLTPAQALVRLRRFRLARLLRRAQLVEADPAVEYTVSLEPTNVVVEEQEVEEGAVQAHRAEDEYSEDSEDSDGSDSDNYAEAAVGSVVEGHLLAPIPGSEITSWLEHGHGGNVYREAHQDDTGGDSVPLLQPMPPPPVTPPPPATEAESPLESQPPNPPSNTFLSARV